MDELKRIEELGSDPAPPRDATHDAARAALLEHIASRDAPAPTRSHRRFRRALGLAGAVAAVAAVLLIVLSSGDTPAGQTVEARAAELEFLAKITPNETIEGPWWSLIGIEAESAAEGRTAFYYESDPEHPDVRWDPRRFAEFRWRSESAPARVTRLESEGWVEVDTQSVKEIEIVEDERTGDFAHDPERFVRIFAPAGAGHTPSPMVGVWEKDGRAFELEMQSDLPDGETFDDVSEKLQKVDSGEFISDARPGLSEEPFTKTVTKPNGETEELEGTIVGPPPPHAPDTPAQEKALYRRLLLNDAGGEAPIIRSEGGRSWMLVRRYASLSGHWLNAE